jgi:hypothetical protein
MSFATNFRQPNAQQFIKDYAQVYEGTSGKVDPKTFYQGLKYSKSAGAQFSDELSNTTCPESKWRKAVLPPARC